MSARPRLIKLWLPALSMLAAVFLSPSVSAAQSCPAGVDPVSGGGLRREGMYVTEPLTDAGNPPYRKFLAFRDDGVVNAASVVGELDKIAKWIRGGGTFRANYALDKSDISFSVPIPVMPNTPRKFVHYKGTIGENCLAFLETSESNGHVGQYVYKFVPIE